ncbi:MAG: hypothetical protein ACI92I_000474 [Acidimicrobiales bacterium]|jgi:hypothetical protein
MTIANVSSKIWNLMNQIENQAMAGKTPEQIAQEVKGSVVSGGFYEVGIKVENTTYYIPKLQPDVQAVVNVALAA